MQITMFNVSIAIVHDFLSQYGGAERCLEAFKEIFTDAPVFTLLYDKTKLPQYKNWNIKTSFLQRFPFWKKNHYIYFALYQQAVEKFDFSNFDIVLSSSVNFSKGIITPQAMHMCYLYTTPRFTYSMKDRYSEYYGAPFRLFYNLFLKRFKRIDLKLKDRPDFYIAISETVRNRLRRYYNKDAEVIYPPVDTTFFVPGSHPSADFFLIVSRLKEYKNVDLAIECFNNLGLKLKIIGTGNCEKYLKEIAKSNIEFLGRIPDNKLLYYYQNCKALILPGEEDFGLVSVEAQACGRPVIALNKGGARETVIDGKTGIFFKDETPQALAEALRRFEKTHFDKRVLRENAASFDKEIFKKKIKNYIYSKYNKTAGADR